MKILNQRHDNCDANSTNTSEDPLLPAQRSSEHCFITHFKQGQRQSKIKRITLTKTGRIYELTKHKGEQS